ncbi:hypothetical protein SBV1_2210035 [Verrucomicrobia bacterium]|nr:hypothetical protein SBV1_2210035 [Verrucomicrobiota bacterium]
MPGNNVFTFVDTNATGRIRFYREIHKPKVSAAMVILFIKPVVNSATA